MKYETIFTPANILIPKFAEDAEKMNKWAVIACDQFTSEPEYWKKCVENISGSPSAYDYIMPEAYLETELEKAHNTEIINSMNSFDPSSMTEIDGLIYVERTLPNGSVRHGIIGKIDLEAYDYNAGSVSPVRATEATVIERIPPRRKIRAAAKVELPHILILINDTVGVISEAKKQSDGMKPIYDFDLMLGGGHITAYALENDELKSVYEKISGYESTSGSLVYAMGDGNHSLAAAKAHWENVKRETGNLSHPARYALCEITALSDESLVFEPIYRIVKNCNTADFLCELDKITVKDERKQKITVLCNGEEHDLWFDDPSHALTVGTLQIFIDEYIKSHPEVSCDYIHGIDSLRKLSEEENTVGFLFDGMDKAELFPYVEAHGSLPRKTFSMGEAESKRYYIELRQIAE